MATKLKYREELFAHEVAAFTPPARAYLNAGYKSRPEFARGNACKLLRKPEVDQRIDELRAEFRARCALQLEYLQEQLLPLIEANALDVFEAVNDANGAATSRLAFKRLADMRHQGRAISGVKLNEDGT